MKNFKCAVFDLDGTVLDSTDVWYQIDKEFFEARGLVIPPDYAKTISPMGFERAAEYTIETFSLPETKSQVMEEWNYMAQQKFEKNVGLKDGAYEYLNYLKSKDIKLCIATASHEELFVPALKRNGVYDLFDCITTLKEVNRGKGFPDVYIKSAQKAGENVEDCVVFEDLLAGIRGALKGGFFTVAVYDKNSEKDFADIKKISNKVIHSFLELM